MRLFGLLALASAFAARAFGSGVGRTELVAYNDIFDNSSYLMTDVACSNGNNGLISKYCWNTLGDIPLRPNAGLGAFPCSKWNSTKVGLVAVYFAISATKRCSL